MVNRRGFVGRVAALFSGLGLGALGGKVESQAADAKFTGPVGVVIHGAEGNPEVWAGKYGFPAGRCETEEAAAFEGICRVFGSTLNGILRNSDLGDEVEVIAKLSVVRRKRDGK